MRKPRSEYPQVDLDALRLAVLIELERQSIDYLDGHLAVADLFGNGSDLIVHIHPLKRHQVDPRYTETASVKYKIEMLRSALAAKKAKAEHPKPLPKQPRLLSEEEGQEKL